jgi:hypothetical protein
MRTGCSRRAFLMENPTITAEADLRADLSKPGGQHRQRQPRPVGHERLVIGQDRGRIQHVKDVEAAREVFLCVGALPDPPPWSPPSVIDTAQSVGDDLQRVSLHGETRHRDDRGHREMPLRSLLGPVLGGSLP